MPPAITVSPRRVTPSRIYCTTPTSRSPKPSPSRARVWPLGKNCSLNVCLNEYSYLTDFQCFGLGRKLRYSATFLALCLSALTMCAICLVIAPLGPSHDGEALLNRRGMQGQHDGE